MLYMVWSFGMLCNYCGQEFLLWDVARDERESVRESKILAEFDCPHCSRPLKKRELKRTKRYPVSVGYRCCGAGLKECTAPPDNFDLQLLEQLEKGPPENLWYPRDLFPDGVNTRQPIAAGITSVDKAYTPRALHAMALLWKVVSAWPEEDVRDKLLFTVTQPACRDQPLGIGVSRGVEDLRDRSLFNDLPGVHDGNRVANLGYYAEVVGDE